MNITAKSKRILLITWAIGVSGISIYALVFFLKHKIYLIGSDTFYYMSIADSIIQSGSALDLTSIPAQPLKTTQNGIVLFHILLSVLGIGPESRLISIVVFNYLLHVSAIYPLYKISRRVGLAEDFPVAALLGVYLGAWHIYRLQLLPNNDGVFNAMSIWFTYLIIVALQDYRSCNIPGPPLKVRSWPMAFALTIVLSPLLVHFRLNTILILGAAIIAAIIVRKYRHALWNTGFLLLSIASVVLLYSFTDTSRISSRNDRLWSDLLSQLPSNIYMLGNQKIPNLLFEDVGLRANLMYGAFALALLLALISGLRKQEAGVVFISLSCTSAILFVTVFYFHDHRFLVYIFPFLYLLILLPRETRPIGYMFVALVLISSLGTFVQGFHRVPASRFWLYLHEQHVTLPDNDPLLISEKSRHPYFFLRGRTARGELRWDQIISHSNLFVLGSDDFVSRSLTKIKIMAEAANFTFERQNLTSGYEDEEGHALIQLYNFCPQ